MSFEAYRVAVKLSLINNVSAGLMTMSRQFAGTGKEATALQVKLDRLKKFTLIGAGMSASGIVGLGILSKIVKPAEEYVHQLNIMNMAGMKQAEIADAVGSAWKLAGENMTTTATGNLKSLLDLRNITGSLTEAREFLPIMARMETVLAASREGKVSGHSGELAFSAMKALDIIGAVKDKARLEREADMMTRVIEGTQGRVTPAQFQSVFQYARQGKFLLSDDFKYKILPTLMMENSSKTGGGGGSKGVGPAIAALYRLTNQGFVNRQSLPLIRELGMLGKGSILPTTTRGTVVAPLTDARLAAENSFEWTNQTLVPRVLKYLARHHMASSDQNVLHILNMFSRGNQLAGNILGEFYIKKKNFERDQKLFEGVMDPEKAFKASMSTDPATAHRALAAQWEVFQTSLSMNVVPILVPALIELSKGLNTLGAWARRHPNLTRDLVIGLGGLAGVLAIGGPLITGIAMSRIAFGGLGTEATPAGGLIGGVAKGLGLLTKAAGVFMAAYIGWQVGGWLNDKINERVKKESGGKVDSLGSLYYERLHNADGSFRWQGIFSTENGAETSKRREGAAAWPTAWPTQTAVVRSIPLVHSSLPVQSVAPGRNQSRPVTINNKIVMPNGRVLAEVVTTEQAREMSRPFSGSSSFDGSMALQPVAYGGN